MLTIGESTGFVAKIAAKIENVTTKLDAPNIRGFLRPTRSRMKMMKLRQNKKIGTEKYDTVDNWQKIGDRPHGAIDGLACSQVAWITNPCTRSAFSAVIPSDVYLGSIVADN